jgi:hypothetical protein
MSSVSRAFRFVWLVLLALNSVRAVALGAGEPDPITYVDELPNVVREYGEETERERYGELLRQFGRNKELPAGYELQALLALSHFPELKDVRVRFVQEDVGIPISSRPRPLSSLRSRTQRLYLVVIDTRMDSGRDALLLKNQPFNAQVGILGHELAHTAWYINRSTLGIVADALCQLSGACRVQFERATDRRLIEHGLGWQRHDHSRFVREGFRSAGIQSTGGGGAYMDPPELLEIMKESGRYGL